MGEVVINNRPYKPLVEHSNRSMFIPFEISWSAERPRSGCGNYHRLHLSTLICTVNYQDTSILKISSA